MNRMRHRPSCMSPSQRVALMNTIYIYKHATRQEVCEVLKEVTCQRTFKEEDHESKSVPIVRPSLLLVCPGVRHLRRSLPAGVGSEDNGPLH